MKSVFFADTGAFIGKYNGYQCLYPFDTVEVLGDYDERFYLADINQSVVTLRPEFLLSMTIDGVPVDGNSHDFSIGQTITINNIPLNTLIEHPDGQLLIDSLEDNSLSWSCAEVGAYQFVFSNFPFNERVINANVTA
ncbi:MAG: hypothetical protein KTR20_12885 [Cellvibrionaceae bacterium]|nr:hypothetical protein [Cellvibrionaceae bacterium]